VHRVVKRSPCGGECRDDRTPNMLSASVEVACAELGDLDQDDSMSGAQLPPKRVSTLDVGQTLRRAREPRDKAIVLAAVVLEGNSERLFVPIKFQRTATLGSPRPFGMRLEKLHLKQLFKRRSALTFG
jgi:hypothetical protein